MNVLDTFPCGRGVMVMAAPEQAQTPMVAEASVQPLSVDMPLSPGGLCNHGQFLHRLDGAGEETHKHQDPKTDRDQTRSQRYKDRAAPEMARRPRTGRVPLLPTTFVL